MTRPSSPPDAARRDRLLWSLLPLSAAVVVGLAVLASALWTGRGAVPVPASVEVGSGVASSLARPAPTVPAGPVPGGAPVTTATALSAPPAAPPPARAVPNDGTPAVVAPDRPVVQQPVPDQPDGGGDGRDGSGGGDG